MSEALTCPHQGVATWGVQAQPVGPDLTWRPWAGTSAQRAHLVNTDLLEFSFSRVRFAETTGRREYTDRRVLGEHSYYVEIWHDSGNYTRSNTVTGEMTSDVPRIMAIDGTEWLELDLSRNSYREQSFDWSVESSFLRTTASRWPVLEISPYESLKGSYECAFKTQDDVRAFEQLRGKVVILKTLRDNVLTGGLIQTSKREREFFTSISFSIQQIHLEEIEHDQVD